MSRASPASTNPARRRSSSSSRFPISSSASSGAVSASPAGLRRVGSLRWTRFACRPVASAPADCFAGIGPAYGRAIARPLRLERRHAHAGQFVGALVLDVAGVALDPVPFHLVAAVGLVERLPQLAVLHRLLVGGLPAVASSSRGSSWRCRPSHICCRCRSGPRRAPSAHSAPRSPPSAPCGCWWCRPRRRKVPCVVAVEAQDRAPAAGAGIARAGAVGENLDCFHALSSPYSEGDLICAVEAQPADDIRADRASAPARRRGWSASRRAASA